MCYLSVMSEPDSIGIRELRQHASRYVAMAKQGKRVAVTDRGELVAYLVPAHEPSTTFQRMVAAGQVRLAEGNLWETLASLEPLKAEPGEKTLSETLREMRDEERY
jgi:prevent-host-death family protein